jgi:hypothetical protein
MLRLVVSTLVLVLSVPFLAQAQSFPGGPLDLSNPTPREIDIALDVGSGFYGNNATDPITGLPLPGFFCNVVPTAGTPSASGSGAVGSYIVDIQTDPLRPNCRTAHIPHKLNAPPVLATSTAKKLGNGVLPGLFIGDGAGGGTLTISKFLVQALFGAAVVPDSSEYSIIPWSDLVFTFDGATGNVSHYVEGTFSTNLCTTTTGCGVNANGNFIPFLGPLSANDLYIFGNSAGGTWTTNSHLDGNGMPVQNALGNPALAQGLTVLGDIGGFSYGDILGGAASGFCTYDASNPTTIVFDAFSGVPATQGGFGPTGTPPNWGTTGNGSGTGTGAPCIIDPGQAYNTIVHPFLGGLPQGVARMPGGFFIGGLRNGNDLFNDLAFYEVPEPGSALMLGLGLIGLAAVRRRRS